MAGHHHCVRARHRFLWLAAGALACAGGALSLTMCGGTVATGVSADASPDRTAAQDGSSSDGTTGFDDGVDAGCGLSCDAAGDVLPGCPALPPAEGSPCHLGQVCEYGSSWWLQCNIVTQCLATPQGEGAWRVEFDGGQCPWLDSGGPCPATWDEASAVDAMPSTCPFVTCVYPEGFCGCGIGCGGGGGLPRQPMDVTGTFTCIPSTPTCPEPRPLSGTACDAGPNTGCSYDFACGCGQTEGCVDGLWQANRAPPCP
jgi:hypothetical protein